MPEFEIQHVTRYLYEGLVRDSANQIILFPIKDQYQEVIRQELSITGHPAVDVFNDYYGNEVGTFTYREPHNQLVIDSKVTVVTRHKPLPVNDIFPGQQWEDLRRIKHIVPFIDFLKQEDFSALDELKAILKKQRTGEDTPYQVAMNFSKYVYENFSYIKGVTTVETKLDRIWEIKAGVCQDFAHILMEMLRAVGIPARYVSGYICTDMRGVGATHAWCEAYIPDYGWLGIDPTNNCIANEHHVRLAVGRNFTDCSPVKGVYKGPSGHKLDVAVTVNNDNAISQSTVPIVEIPKGAIAPKPVVKNSYQRHLDIIRQQQQQQQQ